MCSSCQLNLISKNIYILEIRILKNVSIRNRKSIFNKTENHHSKLTVMLVIKWLKGTVWKWSSHLVNAAFAINTLKRHGTFM